MFFEYCTNLRIEVILFNWIKEGLLQGVEAFVWMALSPGTKYTCARMIASTSHASARKSKVIVVNSQLQRPSSVARKSKLLPTKPNCAAITELPSHRQG